MLWVSPSPVGPKETCVIAHLFTLWDPEEGGRQVDIREGDLCRVGSDCHTVGDIRSAQNFAKLLTSSPSTKRSDEDVHPRARPGS